MDEIVSLCRRRGFIFGSSEIYGGINGTPMPGFGNQLSSEPETIWNLVAYVMSVSNRRRFGEAPPPGPMAPYVPAEAAESDGPRPTATQ